MMGETKEGVPGELPEFAKKADSLEALREAVVGSAGVGGGLWFSYLFVLFYFLVAAGGVTHRDLLYENPVMLPFLNVDLPLLGFFWLGPAIFVIVHAYVLLHLAMLADKVGDFHAALGAQISGSEHEVLRTKLRRQLPSNIFVQFLAGPRRRDGLAVAGGDVDQPGHWTHPAADIFSIAVSSLSQLADHMVAAGNGGA
jgi:hypothetical protein